MSDLNRPARPGALVISLDFELWWGVRDHYPGIDAYRENLLGAREAVPRMLGLFTDFGVAATWATVGFLFASSQDELARFHPEVRPRYADQRLDPYREIAGAGEEEDPFRLAPSLIREIRATTGQELATHTYSHYYCGEPGQTLESFDADLSAACRIAAEGGVQLRSIVFPRNQYQPEYEDVLLRHGIVVYRGNPPSYLWRFSNSNESADRWKRAGRMMDAYLPVTHDDTFGWEEILQENGLANVRASMFVRSYSPARRHLESLRLARIRRSMHMAARRGRLLHLWWHPHNFGCNRTENLKFLREIVREYVVLRDEYGMQSLTMAGAADASRRVESK